MHNYIIGLFFSAICVRVAGWHASAAHAGPHVDRLAFFMNDTPYTPRRP